MVDISENQSIADQSEAPQSKQRKKIVKEVAARKKIASKKQDEFYQIVNGKLLKVTVSGTGNTHKIYVCNADKKHSEYVSDLRKKGQIRA